MDKIGYVMWIVIVAKYVWLCSNLNRKCLERVRKKIFLLRATYVADPRRGSAMQIRLSVTSSQLSIRGKTSALTPDGGLINGVGALSENICVAGEKP